MKKIIPIVVFLLAQFTISTAQEVEVESAIRNSQNIYEGSARFMSMGGAFTALGADLSSLSLNPAGVGVYTGFQLEVTPSFNYQQTKTRTLSNQNNEFGYYVNMNNIGLTGAYTLNSPGWETINFSLGYNKLNNFNKQIRSDEIFNLDRSKMHEFVENVNYNYQEPLPENKNPVQPEDMDAAYEGLAWETYLLHYDDSLSEYWSQPTDEMDYNDTTEIGVNQQKNLDNNGKLGEYFLALGANYENKLYVGISVGIQKVDYSYKDIYGEEEKDNQISQLYDSYTYHGMTFTQYENHSGTGYNFKIGAIYRPIDFLRIGAAFHSPTYFNDLSYTYYNKMTAHFTDGDDLQARNDQYDWTYKLISPTKLLGGIAVKIGEIGMISIDYERLNYGNNKIKAKNEDYSYNISTLNELNNTLDKNGRISNNLRFGGELKLNNFYTRLGYAFYQSPYNDENYYLSDRQQYSGGLGFRGNSFFIDAAYVTSSYTRGNQLFTTIPNLSEIDFTNNKFILSLGFRF